MTNSGNSYTGYIIESNAQYLVLKTKEGELKLDKSQIKSINEYNNPGKFSYPNPHRTRYFFSPSAKPIEKNTGYYQNQYLFFNSFNYGITNNISIGAGVEFISLMVGAPIGFLTPKVAFEINDMVSIGGGAVLLGIAEGGFGGLLYGNMSVGTDESHVTLGIGYGIIDDTWSNRPTINFSGSHRIGNGWGLMSENYILPTNPSDFISINYIGIHGIRLYSKDNAFDIGGIVIPELVEVIKAIPFVGYSRRFGKP